MCFISFYVLSHDTKKLFIIVSWLHMTCAGDRDTPEETRKDNQPRKLEIAHCFKNVSKFI